MDSSALGGSPTQLGPTQATNRSRPRLPGATRAHPGEDNWSDARLPTPFGSGQQGRTGATLSGARRTRHEAPTRDVAIRPMRGLRQSAVGRLLRGNAHLLRKLRKLPGETPTRLALPQKAIPPAAVEKLPDHPALERVRQQTRFLCGIPSPAATAVRLHKHPGFGALQHLRLNQIKP